MTLKDRFKPQEEREKEWYDRAFGHMRNIMKIELSFTPPSDQVQPGKFLFFAKLEYTMFPEMHEEGFKDEDYPPSSLHPMQQENIYDTHAEYFLELEMPYGKYKIQIFYKEVDKSGEYASGDPNTDPIALDDKFLPYFRDSCEPEPISREEQKDLDD